MRARLIQIGNSRGLRLPKLLLEEVGLTDEVEIRVEAGALVITAARSPREGWADAAAKYGPGKLIDPSEVTVFDDEEWRW